MAKKEKDRRIGAQVDRRFIPNNNFSTNKIKLTVFVNN